MTEVVADCVVVAYHRPVELRRLLENAADPRVRWTVVSVDDDPAVCSVAWDVGADVLALAGNPGYAAAVNAGVLKADADVVVFLNDDVQTDVTALLALAALIFSGEADVAVPRLVTPTGANEATIAALPTPAALALEWMAMPDRRLPGLGWLALQKWRVPDRRERIQASAATMVACRRSVLAVEPLPEHYFLYWEEMEWFWRLARRDVRVVYDPEIVVTHAGGRDDVRPEKSRLMARNAVRCVRRTQGRWAAAAAWPVVVLWNVRLVVVDGLSALGSRTRSTKVKARWAGLVAAICALTEIP